MTKLVLLNGNSLPSLKLGKFPNYSTKVHTPQPSPAPSGPKERVVPSPRVRTLTRLIPPIAVIIMLPSAIAATTAQDADILLSQGKPVATSTNESSSLNGAKAVDGNSSTRWASAVSADPQWLRVDLGRAVTVHRVKLD